MDNLYFGLVLTCLGGLLILAIKNLEGDAPIDELADHLFSKGD